MKLLLKPITRTLNTAHARVNDAEVRDLTQRGFEVVREVRQLEFELMVAANELLRKYAEFYGIVEFDPDGIDDRTLDDTLNELGIDIE